MLKNVREAQKFLAEGQQALRDGRAARALEFAEKAEALNPGFYQSAYLRGRALLMLERNDAAVISLEAALVAQPAFLKEKQEIESLLLQARAAR
jgi:tetratricopeptide (TPR) repeat protein